jgi:hypothetical protein
MDPIVVDAVEVRMGRKRRFFPPETEYGRGDFIAAAAVPPPRGWAKGNGNLRTCQAAVTAAGRAALL